jgi:hypothetical protein
MDAMFTAGIALWDLYGLLTRDGSLIMVNVITIPSAVVILDRIWRAWCA